MLGNCDLLKPRVYIVQQGDKNTLIPIIIQSKVLQELTLVSDGWNSYFNQKDIDNNYLTASHSENGINPYNWMFMVNIKVQDFKKNVRI